MQFPLKTILIDDESLALNRLRRLLEKASRCLYYCVGGEERRGGVGRNRQT